MNLEQFYEIVSQSRATLDAYELLGQVQSSAGLFRWCLGREVRSKLADECRDCGPEQDEPFWRHDPLFKTVDINLYAGSFIAPYMCSLGC